MPAPDTPRRPYDASRRQEAARRSRTAVLAAWRDLLLRDGYHAVTVRAVADRAGVSAETVHKAFGGKAGLMKTLWDVTLAGDDEPVPMAARPALQEVLRTRDPRRKLRLYAAFVRDVHERLAPLFLFMSQAGPEAARVLAAGEAERLAGVTAFVTHLADEGLLRAGTDTARTADACWALTGPQLHQQLTKERGWPPAAYEDWLTTTLTTTLPLAP
ncbi:TetR/AcrR family transcriptional regulator [Streptomyces avicenniae]|uniref:TetR/AcrR family transcriptional regulator n=1 Tax=Streptomyces avicenniae TaxID=500153 RepID=UPI00069AE7A8|nr:TetR/AcrR family transcriptional regulator [Streptomyces avicenniae]